MKALILPMNGKSVPTEWRRRSTARRILYYFLVLIAHGSAAQKATEMDYAVHLEPAFTESQIKFVREALLSNDPACLIWPDAPTHRVVVRTVAPIHQAALESAIMQSGLQVVGIDLLLPSDAQERAAMIMASVGFPSLLNTGNPEQDQYNYETAKVAWIDADPERYEELMRALSAQPEQPHER